MLSWRQCLNTNRSAALCGSLTAVCEVVYERYNTVLRYLLSSIVYHTLSYPTWSKLRLFSLYGQHFLKYRPVVKITIIYQNYHI